MPRRVPVGRQPWIVINTDPSDATSPGGLLRIFTAAAALNIGDSVFLSAANSVNKSVTTAQHIAAVGIVVGGTATGMSASDDPADFGVALAANATDQVLVLISGVTFVVADAAMATVGTPICPSTTVAGRVRPAVLGAGADEGKIIGKILEASAGVASVVHAVISLF